MNNTQLDMVLGYLNEGTDIDEFEWLMESATEMINQFDNFLVEEANEKKEGSGILSKIKEILSKVAEFIKSAIKKFKEFFKKLFNKGELSKKQIVAKAKTVEKADTSNIEKEENKEKLDKIKENNVKILKKLNPGQHFDMEKVLKCKFININCNWEWSVPIEKFEKFVDDLEYPRLRKDLRYDEEFSSSWGHHVSFSEINPGEAISTSNIIKQYDDINNAIKDGNELLKRLEKCADKIKNIQNKVVNNTNMDFEKRENILYNAKECARHAKETIAGIQEVLSDLNYAMSGVTKNYNLLLSCL